METTAKSAYAFGKIINLDFDEAIQRTTDELAKEGFGVLTEIDIAATLKKKLDADVPPQRILGACNPGFAHRALQLEPAIGTLLPCNVVVRKDGDSTRVDIMDPGAVMNLVGRPEVAEIAGEVREKLHRVLEAL